jgi:hypothetical protein
VGGAVFAARGSGQSSPNGAGGTTGGVASTGGTIVPGSPSFGPPR